MSEPPDTYLGEPGGWVYLVAHQGEERVERMEWMPSPEEGVIASIVEPLLAAALASSPALALARAETRVDVRGLKPVLKVWCGACQVRGEWRAVARIYKADGGSLFIKGRLATEHAPLSWLKVERLPDRVERSVPVFVSCPNRDVRLVLDDDELVKLARRRDVRDVVATLDPDAPRVACRLTPRQRGRHG